MARDTNETRNAVGQRMVKNAVANTQKPLQLVSWNEKVAKDYEWFHENADYYIGRSRFGGNTSPYHAKLQTLYDVYNNKFPAKWFSHITNPLNSSNPKYSRFPAKIRPVNILRPNLDYLMNSMPLRPFVYHVTNLSPDAVNAFEEALNTHMKKLVAYSWQMMARAANSSDEQVGDEQLPNFVAAKAEFMERYRDKMATAGQDWLQANLPELGWDIVRERKFKDWIIAGEAYSFKGMLGNRLTYERVSPLDIDYGISEDTVFVEDGEWVVRRKGMTVADIVDHFYDKVDITKLEGTKSKMFVNPKGLFSHLLTSGFPAATSANNSHAQEIRYVYHVQWKGRKKVLITTEVNPLTGELDEVEWDENYPFTEEQKEAGAIRTEWRNEVYETWKLAEDVYACEGAPPVQRNEMLNASRCKLHYNGRRWSDTHSDNISPMELGVSYQIMHMILNRTIELTVAKSKGKIALIDKNTVPDTEGWDEDKFLYYGEALGFFFIDRSKPGVDKTMNQYVVLDMTLFDSIKQLIGMRDSNKAEWDDMIGVPRQSRGNMYASDGKATTENSLQQSAVVTDGIFRPFEELDECELQGLLDLSKFDVATRSAKSLYYTDDYQARLFSTEPESYCNACMGVKVQRSGKAVQDLNLLKGLAPQMLQNNAKPSTVAEIITETNLHRLKARLRQIEELEAQMAQQNEELKAAFQAEADARMKMLKDFESGLKDRSMNREYDRKEDLETIKGTFNTFTFQNGDANANNIPDATEATKLALKSKQLAQQEREKDKSREHQEKMQDKELEQQEKDRKSREKIARMKPRKAPAR